MTAALEHQRTAARLMLQTMAEDEFALAGSSALREHGLTDRPTDDFDLFTVDIAPARFSAAVDRGLAALGAAGYRLEEQRRSGLYARFGVLAADGYEFKFDLGADWREHDPVSSALGPVLHADDAVANKISAVYSRALPRDFLDVDAIRRSGRYPDDRLLELARRHDPGFEHVMFGRQLRVITTITAEAVRPYGVRAEEFSAVRDRILTWAESLLDQTR